MRLDTEDVDIALDNGPECHPNLRTLLFRMDNADPDIHDIIKRLPGLEALVAHPLYDLKDLMILQDNCPNLKLVGCNDHVNDYFYVPATTTSNHDDDLVGVHTFYIEYDEMDRFDAEYIEYVMAFMKRNSHSLRHFYFYIPLPSGHIRDDDNTLNLMHAIQTAGGVSNPLFNSMTTYSQSIFGHEDMLMARWVARGSPHLKEMTLLYKMRQQDDIFGTTELFDDLIGLCELESLIIHLVGVPAADMGGLERLILYHGSFDSLLHTLTLPKHIRLSKDALDVLTTLPRLGNLSISWPLMKEEDNTSMSGSGDRCSQFIGKLDQLQHLQISSDDYIPDDVFVQLSKLNIISLKLYMPMFFKSSKSMALLSLLQCPNLQELRVYPSCRGKDPLVNDIRKMLKSKIEEVFL